MGDYAMRYFQGPSAVFNTLRQQVMVMHGLPSDFADEPWPAGITTLALCDREYTPPDYAAIVAAGLDAGITEITAEEYQSLQPKPELAIDPELEA